MSEKTVKQERKDNGQIDPQRARKVLLDAHKKQSDTVKNEVLSVLDKYKYTIKPRMLIEPGNIQASIEFVPR